MSNAEQDSLGVRVSVKSGGCAGMSYVMEYTKEVNPNDEVIEDKGVKFSLIQLHYVSSWN
jgi:iron-sulfur cluster assembly protein